MVVAGSGLATGWATYLEMVPELKMAVGLNMVIDVTLTKGRRSVCHP